jgi:dihydroorotate dehydrogenase
MEIFAPRADYLAINVSSPNTVGLRRLQGRDLLENLMNQLIARRWSLERELGYRTPMLMKLSPDLSDRELDDVLDVMTRVGADGVIASNTTVSRDGLDSPVAREAGGMSGAPLEDRSTVIVQRIFQRTGGELPVIGVGGVMSVDDARAKLDAGAVLVQVYTGLVYAGPGLVSQICRDIKV